MYVMLHYNAIHILTPAAYPITTDTSGQGDKLAELRVRSLVSKVFDGPRNLRDALLEVGFAAPELDTVRKWPERDSIPAGWLAAVIYVGTHHPVYRFDVMDFLVGEHACLKMRSAPTGDSHGIFD